MTHSAQELAGRTITTLKRVGFAAWVLIVLVGMSLGAGDKPSYWRGTISMLLALGLPPILLATWRLAARGMSMLRSKKHEEADE